MVESLKKLTVSYGAFSCTLEGFDDPFPVMKQVVDYFQALADRDPGFGAHPERPDADYLRALAQKSAGSQDIEAEVHAGGVILRQSNDAAEAFAGMEVVEETVVITPSAFLPKADDADTETEETHDIAEMALESQPQDEAALEDVAETPAELEIAEVSDFDVPEIAEAIDVAGLIDADPLPDAAQDGPPELDELAALRADIEHFDTEPVVDTSPVAAELPDILKSDFDVEPDSESTVEDFPGVTGEDIAATEHEVAELAPDTRNAANDDTVDAEDQPEATAEIPVEPEEKSTQESKLPGWAEILLRPLAGNDANDGIDVVDLGTNAIDADAADAEISEFNGAPSAESLDPEDAALERLLKVTQSRRTEPDTTSGSDALSEIREGILGMTPDTPPAQTDDEIAFSQTFEEDSAPDEIAVAAEIPDVPETNIDLPDMHGENMHGENPAEDVAVELPADDKDASTDDKPALEDAPVFDALADAATVEAAAPSLILDKPVNVLPPLQLTPAFQITQDVAEEITEETSREEMTADAPAENTAAPDPDVLVLSDEDATPDTEAQDHSAFRLVHNREEEVEQPEEMVDIPQDADDALSLAIFASKVGAASLPELLEASAAYTTIVTGQTRFSRRSIMGMVDEMNTERKFSQEARIKSFGKLIRSGTILRVEDGQFAISRSAKFNYELKIGA